MNIKITYNWLLEYLETDASPYDLQKFLSLCGPGFERVDKVGDDYVFDIEVTSNRVDMASVFGIAQEATSILPQFGKKAQLKYNPLQKYTFENLNAEPNHHKKLEVVIENPELCPRFTAIILSNINIKPAPEFIRQRLQMCDIKSINNIVDISNYLMLALGQPSHMFDYDKIAGAKMIMRESKKGEKLVTLDDKELVLPGGDIVIEDGEGRLIDLCGIMGGANSAISNETKNIVFFVQTYDKRRLRKTSMLTGQRTVAVTYFEKGLDTERVEPAFVYGIELLNQYSGGIVDSPLYDIYHQKYQPKTINVSMEDIKRVMGVDIGEERVKSILENLGFKVETGHNNTIETDHVTGGTREGHPTSAQRQRALVGRTTSDGIRRNTIVKITVPSFRKDDVDIKEDIIEEVARVYGYHNLPNNVQPTSDIRQPKELEQLFSVQNKTKYFLKHLGMHEVMNYSMISKELIAQLNLDPHIHLKLANTISEEIEYMRTSLLPSLIKNMKDNQGKKEILKFFEIAKTYEPRQGELPHEQYKLGIAVNTDFFDIKGIIEALLNELHITNYELQITNYELFSPNVQAELLINY
jgi:phenylalanyl-tRNA synthetase beta chain